jgi:hypothetical protein
MQGRTLYDLAYAWVPPNDSVEYRLQPFSAPLSRILLSALVDRILR